MHRLLTVWMALSILLTGCSSLSSANPTPTARPDGALFWDDFSKPSNDWETWQEADGSLIAFYDGGLRILSNTPQFDYWSRPARRFIDSRIEVDAHSIGGPENNDYGLICRYQDKENFYAFLISSDGYFGIMKVKDGKYTVLGAQGMRPTSSVQQGKATNHIQAVCKGKSLILSVNGVKLSEVQDADFGSGEAGVIAGTAEKPGADILFDNFAVYLP